MAVIQHDLADLEPEITAIGRALAQISAPWYSRQHAQDRVMARVGRHPGVQTALFRLVDVAPACAGPAELTDHLVAFLADAPDARRLRALLAAADRHRFVKGVTGRAAGLGVRGMAGRFIVGASPAAAAAELGRLWERGSALSVDLLGEATVTPAEGHAYAERCHGALEALASAARGWPARPLLEQDGAGALPRVNLSVKITALTPLTRPAAPERGIEDAAPQLRALLRHARELGAHLHIDMESLDTRELVLELILSLLAEPEFAAGPSAGIVLQAYLRDSEETLTRVLEWVAETPRARPLTVRLVKGAYWDHEVTAAAQHGWPVPVWTEKAESDRCFERLTRRLIDAYPDVRPAIASHNLRSVGHAIAYGRARGLGAGDLELQVLRGLGDDLQRSLTAHGYRCRTYCPVGDLVAGMAYLVRRLLENTANDSFLAQSARGADLEALLRCP